MYSLAFESQCRTFKLRHLIQICLPPYRAYTQTFSSLCGHNRYDSGAIDIVHDQFAGHGACNPDRGPKSNDRHSQTYTNAAVAADAEQCSKIGVDILRQGGNAVDAAIAAMLSVGVINLHSTGIGGGGFMVIYNSKSKTSYAIDFRDKAPLNASTLMFLGVPELECRYGGLTIAVPGMLHGLRSVWVRFGRLPWKKLFQPAITLAREGFVVTKDILRAINMRKELILSGNYPGLQELLAPNGEFLKEGDTLYQFQLATTLEAIAEQGIDYFYNSNFTVEMVTELQQKYGSIITVEDFQKYTAIERQVVAAKFKDYIMLSMPPPACGAILGLILNILDGYYFKEEDIGKDHFHRIIEAFKFAYGQRYTLGDPDFHESVKDVTDYLLDPSTAETMLSQIDDVMTHEPDYYTDPLVIPDRVEYDYGTTHLSVLDQEGNAVAATTTLNLFFGSLVRSSTSGIIFNNEMDNFQSIPGKPKYELEAKANYIVPQKRPLSTSSPTIMLNKDGSIKLVIGASGGAMIPSALAQVITGVLGFKWPLSKAINYPRIHHQLHPNSVVVDMDVEFPLDYQYGLLGKGHDITTTIHRAVVQGIHVDGDGIHATSDFRKGGIPDGY